LDEAARAANKVEPHQLAPVVRVLALLERGDGARRDLAERGESGVAQLTQQTFGTYPQIFVFRDEEA